MKKLISLPNQIISEVQKYADKDGINFSQAVRDLLKPMIEDFNINAAIKEKEQSQLLDKIRLLIREELKGYAVWYEASVPKGFDTVTKSI
jgi:hypothetical protein